MADQRGKSNPTGKIRDESIQLAEDDEMADPDQLNRKILSDYYHIPNDKNICLIAESSGKQEPRWIYRLVKVGMVVKVFHMEMAAAKKYFDDVMKNHQSMAVDSQCGQHILQLKINSDVFSSNYVAKHERLLIAFEEAQTTLEKRLADDGKSYSARDRQQDYETIEKTINCLHQRGTGPGIRNFHGDLKPGNIFFVTDSQTGRMEPKLGDIEYGYANPRYVHPDFIRTDETNHFIGFKNLNPDDQTQGQKNDRHALEKIRVEIGVIEKSGQVNNGSHKLSESEKNGEDSNINDNRKISIAYKGNHYGDNIVTTGKTTDNSRRLWIEALIGLLLACILFGLLEYFGDFTGFLMGEYIEIPLVYSLFTFVTGNLGAEIVIGTIVSGLFLLFAFKKDNKNGIFPFWDNIVVCFLTMILGLVLIIPGAFDCTFHINDGDYLYQFSRYIEKHPNSDIQTAPIEINVSEDYSGLAIRPTRMNDALEIATPEKETKYPNIHIPLKRVSDGFFLANSCCMSLCKDKGQGISLSMLQELAERNNYRNLFALIVGDDWGRLFPLRNSLLVSFFDRRVESALNQAKFGKSAACNFFLIWAAVDIYSGGGANSNADIIFYDQSIKAKSEQLMPVLNALYSKGPGLPRD